MPKPASASPQVTRRFALAGMGAMSGLVAAAAPCPAEALQARADQRAPRYQETDHVRKFYATNRR